mmetsp:Transcript_32/g.32  ORF Transcript_32/g.32 Transcript_32/m.32 type:complete len:128 (+) Transcript_32:30-413(+)
MSSFTVNHIALSVKDVNESINFYQKIFQFKEIENTASNSKTRWLLLGENKQLHLIPRPNLEVKINKAVHFALTTSDLDSFVNHLIDLKIDYSDWKGTPNKDYVRKDGIQQFYFQDPDGYWIEINNAV